MTDPNNPQTGPAEVPTEDDAPRDSLIDRIRPFVLIFLLMLLPIALFQAFRDYMYVCRIPAGTKVVDMSMVRPRSPLGEFIYRSGLIEKWDCPQVRPYLLYRHYVIPNGVETIDNGAFLNYRHLTSIRIPDSVREIGHWAFQNCTALREVDISDKVEKIGYEAFRDCTALERIRLPAGIAGKEPGLNKVFRGCTALQKVTLPDGITKIGESAFQDCSALCEINIPDSVTSIGPLAFQGCSSLPPITLGKQVTDIGGGAFSGTGCRLTVPDDHPTVRLEDGMLYSKDRSQLISCVSVPDGPCIVAPGTSVIGRSAFFGCKNLTEIHLPDGLEIIPDNAFRYCTGLKHVELPDSLKRIGHRAFYACFELEEIAIPPNVTDVEDGAFIECRALKRAVLSAKMGGIPKEMFSHCRSMTEVVIPEGITKIDDLAFGHCTALKHVTFPNSLETISPGAFPYPNFLNSLDQETKERIDQLTPKPPPGTRRMRE